jgi:putative SOS response-associated peptidase YedK
LSSYRCFSVFPTWAELVALYRLTMDAPPHNLRPRYNVCPTDPADVVTAEEGKRELLTMRWGLVPYWWTKPLKGNAAALRYRRKHVCGAPDARANVRQYRNGRGLR